jgi:hypothetical protein
LNQGSYIPWVVKIIIMMQGVFSVFSFALDGNHMSILDVITLLPSAHTHLTMHSVVCLEKSSQLLQDENEYESFP